MKMRNLIKQMKKKKLIIGGRWWGIGYSKTDKKFILEKQVAVDETMEITITVKEVRQQRKFKVYKYN